MRRVSGLGFTSLAATAAVAVLGLSATASAEFAGSVSQYNQGSVLFAGAGATFNTSSAAVGQPSRISGAGSFPSPLGPFNPPYESTEMVAVGVGGSLTLELASPVVTSGGAVQIGVFTGAALNDPTFSGVAESTARTFAGVEYGAERTAVVEIASTPGDFKSLGRVVFSVPTQAFSNQIDPSYMFPDPAIPSDFNQPFVGDLSSFNGLNTAQINTLLNGSAGGTWITVSPSIAATLDDIRYVRLSDPLWRPLAGGIDVEMRQSNADPLGNGQPFFKPADLFVDGVNVVPEPAGLALLGVGMLALGRRRRVE